MKSKIIVLQKDNYNPGDCLDLLERLKHLSSQWGRRIFFLVRDETGTSREMSVVMFLVSKQWNDENNGKKRRSHFDLMRKLTVIPVTQLQVSDIGDATVSGYVN